MNSLTAQQLRIERLKQVREQSKRHYSARLEKYKGIREKDRNAKYEIAKAKKCVKVLNDLEVLSHNWNQSLIETGSVFIVTKTLSISLINSSLNNLQTASTAQSSSCILFWSCFRISAT